MTRRTHLDLKLAAILMIVCALVLLPLSVIAAEKSISERAVEAESYGGGVVTLVTNTSSKPQTVVVASRLMGKCVENPSLIHTLLRDPRLGPSASATLAPHQWFAKWSLFSVDDTGCEVATFLVIDKIASPPTNGLRISKYVHRPDQVPATRGIFRARSVVVEDNLLASAEPLGMALQLQVIAENRSPETRVIAVLHRSLQCESPTEFDWISGPGSAPASIAAGPVSVPPHEWAAFSLRLRGSGDPGRCTVSVSISELLRADSDSGSVPAHYAKRPVWQTALAIETKLSPMLKVTYE